MTKIYKGNYKLRTRSQIGEEKLAFHSTGTVTPSLQRKNNLPIRSRLSNPRGEHREVDTIPE